jgi:tRNA U34 5-methylaminomethyl-2-thiouridine-forming methyltransferase MnmC
MIKLTQDGSTTLYSECFNQYYHSIFGAKTESEKVFIELGLYSAFERFLDISILEMGLGTGLNALLTLENCTKFGRNVKYTAIEAHPLMSESLVDLSFDSSVFHNCEWESWHKISPEMKFKKHHVSLEAFNTSDKFNLVYYDAFAPSSQPELWEQPIFEKVASLMEPDGILVTYCSKSYVQRNLRGAGFTVEKHPGPPRKREVLRAILK